MMGCLLPDKELSVSTFPQYRGELKDTELTTIIKVFSGYLGVPSVPDMGGLVQDFKTLVTNINRFVIKGGDSTEVPSRRTKRPPKIYLSLHNHCVM